MDSSFFHRNHRGKEKANLFIWLPSPSVTPLTRAFRLRIDAVAAAVSPQLPLFLIAPGGAGH
jgi:hypothetical protein